MVCFVENGFVVLFHFQSENDKHLLQETSLAYYFRLYIVTVFLERPADVFGGYNVVGSGGGAGVRRRGTGRWGRDRAALSPGPGEPPSVMAP